MNNIGRIIRGVGGLYSVIPEGGGGAYIGADVNADAGGAGASVTLSAAAGGADANAVVNGFLCSARGVFRKHEITPLVGDIVEYSTDPIRPGYGNVEKILDRRSALTRPPVANVDQLLIVLTLSAPAPDFLLADKLIIHALMNGIRAVICFNKSDIPAEEAYIDDADGYGRAGFVTLRCSVYDAGSIKPLESALRDKITILAGQSGVGKSTLFNSILETRKMAIGDMSDRIKRGRHTTRHVELTRLKTGGWIVDSPGFSLFDAEIGNYRGLDAFYPEFEPYRGMCRFKECSHIHEPDCAVLDALRAGALHAGRHARYAALYKGFEATDNRKYRRGNPAQGLPGGGKP